MKTYLSKKLMAGLLLSFTFSGICYAQTSTESKQNVQKIENSLSIINKLEPVKFNYSKDLTLIKAPAGTQYGFIAEDVKSIMPELTFNEKYNIPSGKNNFKTKSVNNVDHSSIVPFLVGAIKEQQLQIEQLTKQVEQLKSRAQLSK